jgi:PncC family amidohydrolase
MPAHTTPSNETAHDIAADVIHLLNHAGQTVGVAESMTAGMVMSALSSVPGASDAFRGGIVTYATPLKQTLLGVDAGLIEREGVVHPDVAEQMAQGARRATNPAAADGTAPPTTWGIGTTGVAGPDPQDGKPVGTVYIGIASPDGAKAWGPFMFSGPCERIREATVMETLAKLREALVAAAGQREKAE